MGGTINGHGNITPAAEYNIWVDPDAAKLVFNAGFDITMVAWDLITQYTVNEEWEEIKRMNTEMSQLYINFYTHYRNFAMTKQRMKETHIPTSSPPPLPWIRAWRPTWRSNSWTWRTAIALPGVPR